MLPDLQNVLGLKKLLGCSLALEEGQALQPSTRIDIY